MLSLVCPELWCTSKNQDRYCTCASAWNTVQNKLIKYNEESNFAIFLNGKHTTVVLANVLEEWMMSNLNKITSVNATLKAKTAICIIL